MTWWAHVRTCNYSAKELSKSKGIPGAFGVVLDEELYVDRTIFRSFYILMVNIRCLMNSVTQKFHPILMLIHSSCILSLRDTLCRISVMPAIRL